jgi:hypothetical protein
MVIAFLPATGEMSPKTAEEHMTRSLQIAASP